MLPNSIKILSLIGIFTIFTSFLNANSYVSGHSCYKPNKPYEFNSGYELDNFKQEVETYKQCISDFVDKQNNESKAHRKAAEEAIEEWENYVNYELN